MADWNLPTLSSTYANFLTELDNRLDDLVMGSDPAYRTLTNVPTNAIRWSSASSKWQKYNGTSWVDLATTFAENVSTANAWATGRTITLTGDATGTSASWTGSTNLSFITTLATVNTNVGQYGSASSVPVITVNGKGLITAVGTASLGTIATQASSSVSITGGSISGTTLTLPSGAGSTTEGVAQWNGTSDLLTVGTGTLTKTMCDTDSSQTLTNKTLGSSCTWNGNDIAYGYLTQGAGLSVLGVAGSTSADLASIAAGTDGHVLRRSGTTLGFGTIATAALADDAVTYAKIQNVSATDKILGRATAGAGDVEEIACTSFARTLLDDANAGTALTTLGAALNAVNTKSTNYTVVAADRGKLLLCDTAGVTISLDSAVTLGNGFAIAVSNISTGSVTIDPSGNEYIDSAATITLDANQSAFLVSTGNQWKTVGNSSPVPPQATTYTSSGTWQKPSLGKMAYIECWGGGGGGGKDTTYGGGGGGGGAYQAALIPLWELPSSVEMVVGAGGAGRSTNIPGGLGGRTSFGDFVSAAGGLSGGISYNDGSNYYGGSGGSGGFSATYGWSGGDGGSGGAGGENGSTGKSATWGGGGGGCGAFDSVPGATAGGASTYGGAGGAGAHDANNGGNGAIPGGGGGGAEDGISGSGGAGRIVVTIW